MINSYEIFLQVTLILPVQDLGILWDFSYLKYLFKLFWLRKIWSPIWVLGAASSQEQNQSILGIFCLFLGAERDSRCCDHSISEVKTTYSMYCLPSSIGRRSFSILWLFDSWDDNCIFSWKLWWKEGKKCWSQQRWTPAWGPLRGK